MDMTKPPYSLSIFFRSPDSLPQLAPTSPQLAAARPLLTSDYYPWRRIKRIAQDAKAIPEEAWTTVLYARLGATRPLMGLYQENGDPFVCSHGGQMAEPLHRVDRATGGGGPSALNPESGGLGDPEHRQRIRIRTLMDEAAESSLIEGAASTRKEAIELLRSGREPAKPAERMIFNNYRAMQRVKDLLTQPLTLEMLLDLQTILTRDTLANPDETGRFRLPNENVRVWDDRDNVPIFTPPSAIGLKARLLRLCDFANQNHEGPEFIHPIVKAAILHFMIGYEHPFCDGNGRTARAVFYWYSLRSGYKIFEYLAVSELIRKGSSRYTQAYLDSEMDGGDLTYFVLYKLDIIEQSLDKLATHLRREEEKLRRSEQLLRISKDLNLRQRLLLEHALRHPLTQYTVKSHMNSNGTTPVTARADLQDLVRKKLMTTMKRGKEVLYVVKPSLAERLSKKSKK